MTKAEKARILSFGNIGCIVSNVYFNEPGTPYDVHHLTIAGRRLGHMHTVPLSPWFHRGVPLPGKSQAWMTENYGPSLAKSKAAFERAFCTELELLAKTNELLGVK